MIFVTDVGERAGIQELFGVLLGDTIWGGFRKDIFRAYLVSDVVREIRCEQPQEVGGIGSSRNGTFYRFTTQLFGTLDYYKRTDNRLYEAYDFAESIAHVAENRIYLVTPDNVAKTQLPAFLSDTPISPPISTQALIRIEIEKLDDLPELQLLGLTEKYIYDETHISGPTAPLHEGLTLPVSYQINDRRVHAAMHLHKKISDKTFDAYFYHEANAPSPRTGLILERKATKIPRKEPATPITFQAVVGTVLSIADNLETVQS
jgi:hypothetical protein